MSQEPEEELKRRVLNRGFDILHDLVDIANLIVLGTGAKLEKREPLKKPTQATTVKKVAPKPATGDSGGQDSTSDSPVEGGPAEPKDPQGSRGRKGADKGVSSKPRI